jgi:hypothetical protein
VAKKKTKLGAVGTVSAVAEPGGPVAMPIGNQWICGYEGGRSASDAPVPATMSGYSLSTPGRDTRFHPGDPGRPLGSRNKLADARDVAGDLRSAIAKS